VWVVVLFFFFCGGGVVFFFFFFFFGGRFEKQVDAWEDIRAVLKERRTRRREDIDKSPRNSCYVWCQGTWYLHC